MAKLASVWDWRPFYPFHDPHLWTIQYEFRSSLLLYLLLLLVAKARVAARLALLFGLCIYNLCWDRWEILLHLSGTFLAQWDIMRAENGKSAGETLPATEKDLDTPPAARTWSTQSMPLKREMYQAFYGALFILALWLLSAPKVGFTTEYGYQTLSLLIPSFYSRKEKFLPTLGSILLIWLLSRCSSRSMSHNVLKSQPVQYLDRISFSLYLVHGPILHLFGYYSPILFRKVFDRKSNAGYCAGLFLGWFVNLASVLPVADAFYREIDLRCVRIAGWLEDKCFVKDRI